VKANLGYRGEEVFVDVVPIELMDEFIQLLKRGVKVNHLRRINMIKSKREKLGLPKSSKGDLIALMPIERRWFREVNEDFLIMRRKISAFRGLLRDHQSKLERMKNMGDDEKEVYRETIESEDRVIEKMASLIINEARKRITHFD